MSDLTIILFFIGLLLIFNGLMLKWQDRRRVPDIEQRGDAES